MLECKNRRLTPEDFYNGTIKKGDVLTWYYYSIGKYVLKSRLIGVFDKFGEEEKHTIVFSYAIDDNKQLYIDTAFRIFWGANENYLAYADEFEEDLLDEVLENE